MQPPQSCPVVSTPATALIRQMFVAGSLLLLAAPLLAQGTHRPLHVDPSLRDCEVVFAPELSQQAYHRFVREFGSVSAFKQVASPATIGKGRLLIGIEVMRFSVDQWSDAWHDTFAHPDEHHPLGASKEFPKIKLAYGATDDLDVGAYYTTNPNANYGWLGIDARYRVLDETDRRSFSVAARGAYTRTLYVEDMSMHALTADLSIGRTVAGVRPYAGAGVDAIMATEKSPVVDLEREMQVVPHFFGGVEATFRRRLSVAAEVSVGARPSLQVQLGGVLF